MNYKETLEYIHGVNWQFCKPGLERIGELCERLGHPESELKFVHVAGTNGKGSFCSMMSSILQKAGYKVGLYTSPYVRFFNERMCVDGEPISNDELAEITEYVRPIADSMRDRPTEFELITAIAFEYFKRNKCDVVVLEAGMGGRFDSTNIIKTPLISVITGIALDHVAFLGDTVEKIAAEKAGIIKRGIPVLYGGNDVSAERVIREAAEKQGSDYFSVDYAALDIKHADLSGTVFDFDSRKNVKINLLGLYQPRNASLVLTATDILKSVGLDISETAIYEGLASARWAARFEVVNNDPLVIFDGAHNPQGIDASVKSIEYYFKSKKVCVLTGVLRDKDHAYIAERLSSVADRAFVITPDNPRALSADEYAAELCDRGVEATPCANIGEAYELACKAAKERDSAVVCLGSLYTYSELMSVLDNAEEAAL